MAVWGRFAPYAETNWIFYIALIYLPNVHMISVLFLTHDPHTSSDTQNTFGGQLNKYFPMFVKKWIYMYMLDLYLM